MAKDNEYSEYFDDAPVAAKPARKTAAAVAADSAPADAAPADASESKDNPYLNDYGIARENAARLEAGRAAFEKQKQKDQAAKIAKEREFQQNMGLAVTAGSAGAGALLGASRTPDYRQAFVDLASEVYGASPESVEKFLMKKYPQPDTSAQIAKGIADEELMAREANAAAKNTPRATNATAGAGEAVVDKHGTVRWVEPRVSTKVGIPSALTDQIITLTGGANVSGSGENILAQNAENVRKLKAMGYDVANMQKEGDLLVPQERRKRPTPPEVPTWSSGRGTINYQLPKQPLDLVEQLGRASPQVDMAAGLPTPVAATQSPARAPAVAPAAAAAAAAAVDDSSYAKDLAKRIEKAGGLASILSRGAKAGLYGGATAMSGLDLWHAINSMMQNGINTQNTAQGVEGAGFLGALKYPRVGLGVAGGAKTARAGENMYDTGVTPENAAKMASGLGIAAMPYGRPGAIAGAAMQIPELTIAAKEGLLELAKKNPQWLKAAINAGSFDPMPGQ